MLARTSLAKLGRAQKVKARANTSTWLQPVSDTRVLMGYLTAHCFFLRIFMPPNSDTNRFSVPSLGVAALGQHTQDIFHRLLQADRDHLPESSPEEIHSTEWLDP